jgi:hypothetical protein
MDSPTSPKCKSKVDKFGVPKKVHYVIIANMIPALSFCLPSSINSSNIAPALGLIPAGLAAILAVYRSGLYRLKKKSTEADYQILLADDREARRKRLFCFQGIFFAIADFVFLAGLIIAVVFSITSNRTTCRYSSYTYNNMRYSNRWCSNPRHAMLVSYATMPLLINA